MCGYRGHFVHLPGSLYLVPADIFCNWAKKIGGGKVRIYIFPIYSVFEFFKKIVKKCMHWLGPVSQIGLNDKLGKFKKTKEN